MMLLETSLMDYEKSDELNSEAMSDAMSFKAEKVKDRLAKVTQKKWWI